MAVLTAVDMGSRTFLILIPADAHAAAAADSVASRAATANVLVKAGGLEPPALDQLQPRHMPPAPPACHAPPLRASPYETGLCVDKGSAGSSAGVLRCSVGSSRSSLLFCHAPPLPLHSPFPSSPLSLHSSSYSYPSPTCSKGATAIAPARSPQIKTKTLGVPPRDAKLDS